MRILFLLLLAGCAAPGDQLPDVSGQNQSASSYSSDAYAGCAACHLEDGAGVPGAFPRLRNRAAEIASLEGGPDYLAAVVANGLMGNIKVDGQQYFGVMPGNKGLMSADEMAAALNYVVFELIDGERPDVPAFSAAGLARHVANVSGPAGSAELREVLVERYGDSWPQ